MQVELYAFDVIALTETWLHPDIDTDEITFHSHSPPERKNNKADRHVKEYINYRRRRDLDPRNVECVWIEITNKHKHDLFGIF